MQVLSTPPKKNMGYNVITTKNEGKRWGFCGWYSWHSHDPRSGIARQLLDFVERHAEPDADWGASGMGGMGVEGGGIMKNAYLHGFRWILW